ncbi:hypothetical protein N7507_007786 [Penicillium longicatenatum]|nr:hypothetical protein N7507_007786 [Penicillium longicatenatum]
MMSKKEFYTNVTPLPPNIPRQLALDILHSHSEIITLNPLVLSHHPIKAPRNASADEYYSTWYEIFQRVQYVPGLGKMGSGKISFKGCFENHPWGVKTHTYPPMGIDLLSKFRIAGTQFNELGQEQDSEPQSDLEQRIPGAPAKGLYLLEEIEIKCNITLMSFVKSQLKAASKVLVDRLIKKAELLDAGVLQALFEDGKLRTFNPADRTENPIHMQAQLSPTLPHSPTGSSRWGSISSRANSVAPSYGTEYRKSLGGAVELPDTSAVNRGLPFTRFDKGFPTELPAMEEVPREYK